MQRGSPVLQGRRHFDQLSAQVLITFLLVTTLRLATSYQTNTFATLCDALRSYRHLNFTLDEGRWAVNVEHNVLDTSSGYISGVVYKVRVYSNINDGSVQGFVISALGRDGQFAGNFTSPLLSNTSEIESCGNMNIISYIGTVDSDGVIVYWQIDADVHGLGCVEFSAIIQGSNSEWYLVSKSICEYPGNEVADCVQYRSDADKGGFISSPYYPNPYPDDIRCFTFLHAQPYSTLFLQFLDLDVEFEQQCGYDYVNVYTENFTTGHSEKRCGKYREDTLEQLWFQSSGNIMGVQLSSDFKYGYRGYHAQYYSLDQRQGCNKTLTLESGSISSWNYPSNYFPNLHCNILINVATDQRIRFEIQFLDIQNGTVEYLCDTDFLQVFQGQGTRPTTFCGTTDKYRHDQLIFDSEENEIQLLFYSDYLTEKDGFLGRYYALDSCRNESIFAMNGTISSPNYPNFYPNSQDCYITLQAPQGYQLLVHFETFNTQDGNLDSCNDFVEVFTGNDTIKLCGNWQGRQNQLVYQSVSNIFRIHFFTDGYGTAKGFRADFSAILYNRTVVFNPTCPQGWLHFKRFCYEIVNITRTWYEANDACQREGTNLASIHSLGEQHFINSAICESTGTENGAYWIGGHDQHYEAEFMWADNSVFNFTDWFPGWSAFNYFGKQPTDDGFSTEDCIELRQVFHYPSKGEGRANRYYWNDRDCHTQNHYICKQLAFGAQYPTKPVAKECNQHLNSTSGVITTPYFPHNYANMLDCIITIEVSQGNRIIIEFTDFLVEDDENCQYDYVQVFTPGEEERPADYCGDWTSDIKLLRRVTPSNTLIIKFHTDHSRTFTGFRAVYKSEPVPSKCDSKDWLSYNGYCYLASWGLLQKSSWNVAKAVCQDLNATLATIFSANQYYFLEETLRWNNLYKAGELFWLGGDDIISEGMWVWSHGEPINESFTAWFPGWVDEETGIYGRQPSGGNNKDCLAMSQELSATNGATKLEDRMYWMDKLCNTKANFVCQKKQKSTQDGSHHKPILLSGASGNFSSENFPNNYDNNMDNVTIIEVPSGYRIQVGFFALNLEYHKDCLYDYVSLNDSIQYVRYCGNHTTQLDELTFWSLTNQITITFHSDYSISDLGYSAYYDSFYIKSCENDILKGMTGYVTSVRYPGNYLNSLSCQTDIRVPQGYRVFLEFEDFQLQASPDCKEDYVFLILDGLDERRTARYCGDRTAVIVSMKFVSYGSVLKIVFHSNDRNVSVGFSAKFTAVKEVATVINLQSHFNANVVSSLNYPNPYPGNTNMTLIIEAPPDNSHVVVSFSGCLSVQSSNCTTSVLKIYNYLLHGELHEEDKVICGDTCNGSDGEVLVFQSILNSLMVQFISHTSSVDLQGFEAIYRTIPGNGTCGLVYCSGHGKCVYKNNQYECSCDKGYKGTFCDVKQPAEEKTLLERLMADPFWIGIIAIIVFLLLGLFIIFLRKRISKHLQNKREVSVRSKLGKRVNYNAGSTNSFGDGTGANSHLNSHLQNGNTVSYDPSRVNEIALHDIEILENGHAVTAREDEYDDYYTDEMDGETSDGRRSPRYLENRATVANALGKVVPAVALSSVKAQKFRPSNAQRNTRGPRRFIPNILKSRQNEMKGTQDGSAASKWGNYLRTRRTPVDKSGQVDETQMDIKGEATSDTAHLHADLMPKQSTDGQYLNEVFQTVYDEEKEGNDHQFEYENHEEQMWAQTDNIEEEARDTYNDSSWHEDVHEASVRDKDSGNNWQEVTSDVSDLETCDEELKEEFEQDTLSENEIHRESMKTIDEITEETDNFNPDTSSFHQYSTTSSVDLSDIQPTRGRSKPSLRSLHRQPVIFESMCESDPTDKFENENHEQASYINDSSLDREVNLSNLRASEIKDCMNGIRPSSFDSGNDGVSESRFSDSDKETVIVNPNGEILQNPRFSASQSLDDYDFEEGSDTQSSHNSFEGASFDDIHHSNDYPDQEVNVTSMRRKNLVRQKTSSCSFSDLEPIQEGSILRTDACWNSTVQTLDDSDQNSEDSA